ncbi:MAG TPA: hypothetical protein VM734_32075 [Kofleriaceae bacterium]|jgi:hypothetical protein|nr:hypothetical protein [Kofleriaceae bacterium]
MLPTDEELDEGRVRLRPSTGEERAPDEPDDDDLRIAEEVDDPGSCVQHLHTGLVGRHTDSPDDLDDDPARPAGMISPGA